MDFLSPMSASKVASKSQNFLIAPSSTYALTIQWLYYKYVPTYLPESWGVKKCSLWMFTSHSTYVATATESDGVKIDSYIQILCRFQ